MANQYNNKVVLSNGTTLMDITDTTATASDVASGKYFYTASGEKVEGTNPGGITPTGSLSITDEGTYDVTNYAEADVDIDYESKLRAVTFVINRTDSSTALTLTNYGSFGNLSSSNLDFSDGIKSIQSTTILPIGDTTGSKTYYYPKGRPVIIFGTPANRGNYDVTIDSSYGECIPVPHIAGSSSSLLTKAIYLKTSAPDQITVTITMESQAAYPETVVTSSLSVNSNDTYTAPSGTAYSSVTVAVPTPTPTLQTKSATPTESAQTVEPDSGYDGLSSVSVGAISSSYVGSGITRRDDTDLSASGATVTVPAGYYEDQETKSVASGTAGTPTATKGTVSNHSVNVTPSVTNTAGYISDGTLTGTAVSVSASELDSGTKSISENGTSIDVVGYAAVDISVPNSFSITDTSNTTGTTAVITAGSGGGGGTPSVTHHEIHLEFSDSTDEDIDVYYDDSLISAMITAYPIGTTGYGQKTVDLAELDGTAWYTRPAGNYETIYDANMSWYHDNDNDYPYCWVSTLSNVSIPVGSEWRITYGNTEYYLTAASGSYGGVIGNPKWGKGTDDGSNVPFVFENAGWGAWTGSLNATNIDAQYHFKIERKMTS